MNLLPTEFERSIKRELRARFLLTASCILLGSAFLVALSLAPAAITVAVALPASASSTKAAINTSEDTAAATHTKAMLAAIQSLATSTSLTGVSAALSDLGPGITLNAFSYSATQHTLSLSGHAQTAEEVNALRQTLQADSHFSNVSVPVSALIGSQSGGFTITMQVK